MAKKDTDTTQLSKTARASLAKKQKQEGFKASGDMPRIVSLNGGQHAYLFHPVSGKTFHLAVGSEKWSALIAELDATEHGPRIQEELAKLGW